MPRIIKRIIGIIVSLAGLVMVLGIALTAFCIHSNSPPDTSEEEPSPEVVRFEVRKGESAQSVGIRLAESGLIRNQYFWYLLNRYEKDYIKSGAYLLEVPASQIAIHRTLVSGKQLLLRVTIAEGLTLKKTAALLEEADICPAEEFLAAAADPEMCARYRIPGSSMEGYLYPDTYLFPPQHPAEKVVQAMADNFFDRIGELDESTVSMPPEELNKLVILASIVEREYRLDEEAPVMAGVFLNRLKIGMALQSCATVEYVITEIQGKPHPEVLSGKDIEIRDPYNTYIRPGLPPGPISAPGSVALRAVLAPAKSTYLYFRLVEPASGKHYFSNTLDDHIKAGRLYLKGRS